MDVTREEGGEMGSTHCGTPCDVVSLARRGRKRRIDWGDDESGDAMSGDREDGGNRSSGGGIRCKCGSRNRGGA